MKRKNYGQLIPRSLLVKLQFDEQKMDFFDSRDFKKEHTLIDQILSSN